MLAFLGFIMKGLLVILIKTKLILLQVNSYIDPIKSPHHDKVDLSDGQFSERCDVNGSFFNSDAIPIIFGKA